MWNHSPDEKRVAGTSLVDRAIRACSPHILESGFEPLRVILFGNRYLISLVNSVIENCIKKFTKTDEDTSNIKDNAVYLGLPYIKGVSDRIARNLKKNIIFTFFKQVELPEKKNQSK